MACLFNGLVFLLISHCYNSMDKCRDQSLVLGSFLTLGGSFSVFSPVGNTQGGPGGRVTLEDFSRVVFLGSGAVS